MNRLGFLALALSAGGVYNADRGGVVVWKYFGISGVESNQRAGARLSRARDRSGPDELHRAAEQ